MVRDMLFATLDTTHRKLPLPNGKPAVLSDTVGFIADLPTNLVTAFRATLEEVKEADLILHVRDMADPMSEAHKQDVLDILNMLEAGPEHGQDLMEVWNKADLLSPDDLVQIKDRAETSRDHFDIESACLISCITGLGIENLRVEIEKALTLKDDIVSVAIPPKDYKIRAWLHSHGQVLEELTEDDGMCVMQVQLSDADAGKLRARHPEIITVS